MLTIAETQEQAKKSDKAALECSIKHWWENAHLTTKELSEDTLDPCEVKRCALCARYYRRDCSDCPLAEIIACDDDGSAWGKAVDALDTWRNKHSTVNFKAWQKAAHAMHRELCSLRTKV